MLTIPLLLCLQFVNIHGSVDHSSLEFCESNALDVDYCKEGNRCEGKIELSDILDQKIGEDNIFFIETSSKDVIAPREACALESASRNSGLHVVMVRVGKVLDKSDNTTCQILNHFQDEVSIYSVDLDRFSAGSPIHGFFSSQSLQESMNK